MNTLQAVNHFKGVFAPDLDELTQIIIANISFGEFNKGQLSFGLGVKDNPYWKVVCNKEEFKQCVQDCIDDFGKIKNIQYNRVIGQLNTVYRLEDDTHAVLDGACATGFYVSRIDSNDDSFITESIYPSTLVAGVIAEVKVELEDKQLYRFTINNIFKFFMLSDILT